MSLCPLHHIFYTTYCPTCRQDAIKAWKASEKAKKQTTVKKYTIKSDPTRQRLKDQLQSEWRAVIFPYYQNLGLTSRCWISTCKNKLYLQSGSIFAAHVSHYYDKGTYYHLWTDPVNSGICCPSCNINNKQKVADMETMMIWVWGRDAVDALKARKEALAFKINTGIIKKYPPTEWLQAMIKATPKIIIPNILHRKS